MDKIVDIKDLNGREISVGEKVRIDGEVYECVEGYCCYECAFEKGCLMCNRPPYDLKCSSHRREDNKGVIYVKQEQMEANENKELDIAEILRGCPDDTELYSPMLGNVKLNYINGSGDIQVRLYEEGEEYYFWFRSDGRHVKSGDVMLFPSKDQRDWSKFKALIPPFDIERGPRNSYYYCLDTSLRCKNDFKITVITECDHYGNLELGKWSTGNYFNTKQQAIYAAEKVKELLLSLRKEDK